MALNIEGYYTPEQRFEGIYQAADTMERNRYRDEQMQRQKAGQIAATGKFLTDYLDPKDRLTGTNYDPEIVRQLNEALIEGADLAKKGASASDILMALGPKVGKINEYSQKAKLINAQKKAAIEKIKNIPGIDAERFSEEYDNIAFYDTDPKTGGRKLKEISSLDPEMPYANKTLMEGDVYNNKGIDEFVAKSGKETTVEDVSVYDSRKAMKRTKAEITKPSYMVSDVDERKVHKEFVPEFEIATDDNQPILHKFKGHDDTEEVEAPVRMVTKEVFNSLSDPAKAYILQETRKYAKQHNIPLSSANAEMFGRAIAYDELKNSAKNYSTLKEVSVQKEAPIRIYNSSVGGSGSGADANINDVYGRIYAELKRLKDYGEKEVKPNLLKADEQKVIRDALDNLNKGKDEGLKIELEDVWIELTDQNEVIVKDANRRLLFTLPKLASNLKNTPTSPGKKAVVAEGEPDKSAKPTTRPPLSSFIKK